MARRRTHFVPPKEDPPLGLEWMEYEYRRRGRKEYRAVKNQFTKIRGDFLSDIAQHNQAELRAWGIRDHEIMGMREGVVPEGFSVHHIKPLDSSGGTNEYKNLVLIPQKPFHDGIHAYLNPQVAGISIGNKRMVKLPVVKGPVYQPGADAIAAYAGERRDAWRAKRAANDLTGPTILRRLDGIRGLGMGA